MPMAAEKNNRTEEEQRAQEFLLLRQFQRIILYRPCAKPKGGNPAAGNSRYGR